MLRQARIRRLAAQVLLVWLLALATGVVNACVIAPHTMSGPGASASALPPAPADHAGACPDCPDDGAPGLSQGPCAKFCVDKSGSVPSAALAFDPGPASDLAPVPTMALSVQDPSPRVRFRHDGATPRGARHAIAIACQRLTL